MARVESLKKKADPLKVALPLMEEGWKLKEMLKEKVKDGEYDPEFHLVRRYKEIKEQLGVIQAELGTEEILVEGFKFEAKLQSGRKMFNKDLLTGLLLARGIPADEIAKMYEAATKEGEPFWVKEISKA